MPGKDRPTPTTLAGFLPPSGASAPTLLPSAARRREARRRRRPGRSLPAAVGRRGVGTDGKTAGTDDTPATYDPDDDGGGDGTFVSPPLLVYSVVPFLPPALLCSSNDDYLSARRHFDALASSVPPNVVLPPDSAEYLSLSSSYDEAMRSLLVLLVSRRLALYFLATVATAYAGWRASSTGVASMRRGENGGPGDALDRLNREVLAGERQSVARLAYAAASDDDDDDDDVMGGGPSERGAKDEPDTGGDDDDEDDDGGGGLFASLVDDGPRSSEDVGTLLALALPLVLGASLATSYLVTTVAPVEGSSGDIGDAIGDGLSRLLPVLSTLSGAAICLLFVATEFRWAVPATTSATTSAASDPRRHPPLCAGNLLALAYVVGAYLAKVHPTLAIGPAVLDLWPLQNGVNVALAATVARALSPFLLASSSRSGKKSIRTVALALLGLALFDAVATFGTVANAALAAAPDAAAPSMSVMEAVARSKLASWQPGLLEVIIGHDNSKVTEALGLGDVVFPSVLVAWGFAADNEDHAKSPTGRSNIDDDGEESNGIRSSGGGYASASVLGYVFGSFVTEIVGSFALLGTRLGLPALVFLIPSMLGAVTVMAWSRNELSEIWGVASCDFLEDNDD